MGKNLSCLVFYLATRRLTTKIDWSNMGFLGRRILRLPLQLDSVMDLHIRVG
jgi:hypothetical protein